MPSPPPRQPSMRNVMPRLVGWKVNDARDSRLTTIHTKPPSTANQPSLERASKNRKATPRNTASSDHAAGLPPPLPNGRDQVQACTLTRLMNIHEPTAR